MKGKTVLLTGASQGIGYYTALELAKLGANMVLVGRSAERMKQAADNLAKASGNDRMEVLLADLSSMADIRRLASDFRKSHDRLHVLVNNAGAYFGNRQLTPDGYEATFATNHLNYFLLTEALLDILKATAPARIVSVASDGHRQGRIDFDDLMGERRYDGLKAYCQSKLANVMHAYQLAKRLEGTGVTANCLHPGGVATNFAQDHPGWFGWVFKWAKPFLVTPQKGALTSIYLASSPLVEGVTGQYFAKCLARRSSGASYDERVAKRLWEVSEGLVGKPS